MGRDDQLFFFVIDHGGTTDNSTSSYINLWGTETLQDNELASMLAPFKNKYVNVNVVLGQCFSGGFVDNLNKMGFVVTTACEGSESSWSCPDIPYDEFVYHWTCAVNGADHRGIETNADDDSNGKVTMEEAFNYAFFNDRRDEHPIFNSNPISIGEDLAFNKVAESIDLYIKDTPFDMGKEPNHTEEVLWNSPSIWVRNQMDGEYEHQNPEYSADHQLAYVYVRIHNRGKEDFNGNGKWVHVYWAQASTAIHANTWKGREVYDGRYPTGGHLEAAPIDTIEAGGYKDVCIRWSLPRLLEQYPEGNFHFCLLAKIMDTPYDDGYVEGKAYFDVRGSNDHAQKNLTIIKRQQINIGFNVYVRNPFNTTESYTLELVPHSHSDISLYDKAKVELTMGPRIYSAWQRGGFVCRDVEFPSSNENNQAWKSVKFVSPRSNLQNISLDGNEFDIVKLKFDFVNYPNRSNTYTFDLIQRDVDGNIMGGETFIIESPGLSLIPIEISATPYGNGEFELSVDKAGFDYIIWKNEEDQNIGSEENITVKPTVNNDSYKVIAITEDGDISTDHISLKDEYGISSVYTTSDAVSVNLKSGAPSNACVSLTSVADPTFKISHDVPVGHDSVSINATTLSKGIYVVGYHVDSEIVDMQKISIQ